MKTLFILSIFLFVSACSAKATTKAPTKGAAKAGKGAEKGDKLLKSQQLDEALADYAQAQARSLKPGAAMPPPPGFVDKTNDKFQAECLKESNVYRKKHKAPPLKTDKELVAFAKSRCILVVGNVNIQNGNAGPEEYGENIYLSSTKDFNNCTKVVEKWYSTFKEYDYKKADYIKGTGQFTQLVWVGTEGLGCAVCSAQSPKGPVSYVVCNYSPSGNYQGEYPENVLKP